MSAATSVLPGAVSAMFVPFILPVISFAKLEFLDFSNLNSVMSFAEDFAGVFFSSEPQDEK